MVFFKVILKENYVVRFVCLFDIIMVKIDFMLDLGEDLQFVVFVEQVSCVLLLVDDIINGSRFVVVKKQDFLGNDELIIFRC